MTAFYKYPENLLKRGMILLGLSSDLISLGHKEEALAYYAQAIDHVKEKTTKLTCLKTKMNLEIECGEYSFHWFISGHCVAALKMELWPGERTRYFAI